MIRDTTSHKQYMEELDVYERKRERMKNNKRKNAGKHQQLVDTLEARLIAKPYVDDVKTNVIYALGECDIITLQGNNAIYYEVKGRHTTNGYMKARDQLYRWSKYFDNVIKGYNFYGVYWTPDLGPLILVKDSNLQSVHRKILTGGYKNGK